MNCRRIFLVLAISAPLNIMNIRAQNIILPTEADSVSFYLGYMFGKQLAESGAEVNVHILSSGMRNALAKTPVNLNDAEIGALMQKYFGSLQAAGSEKYLSEGKKFLDDNAKKPGVVTLPSGLQYKVIREGTGAKPKLTDQVAVIYHGTLIDGTVFDSSKERGDPVIFPVDGVISGFSEALMLMNEGSLWEIYLPPNLGYGESPAGNIKPNSVLIFEVDLIKIPKFSVEKVIEEET